jgi:hypothetical protein
MRQMFNLTFNKETTISAKLNQTVNNCLTASPLMQVLTKETPFRVSQSMTLIHYPILFLVNSTAENYNNYPSWKQLSQVTNL